MSIVQVDSRSTRLYKCFYTSCQDSDIITYKYLFYNYEFYPENNIYWTF